MPLPSEGHLGVHRPFLALRRAAWPAVTRARFVTAGPCREAIEQGVMRSPPSGPGSSPASCIAYGVPDAHLRQDK